MPDRKSAFRFQKWVWQHLPPWFTRLGESSLMFSLLKALCSPFEGVVSNKIRELQKQVSLNSATGGSLDEYGKELGLEREEIESDESYRNKLIILDLIFRTGISIANIKALTFAFLGAAPEVYSAWDAQQNEYVNTQNGLLVLGLEPESIDDEFKRFVYYIVLPDLGSTTVNRRRYLSAVVSVNYGANEPFVVEKKDRATGIILSESTIGTIKSYITSILYPNPILVEKWF